MHIPLKFEPDFLMGTATSAYQVEGSLGVRDSDWDQHINRQKNEIIRPGEIGPNWWDIQRAEGDLTTAAHLGAQIQRIGIEWARIEPERGFVNASAIGYYRQLIGTIRSLGMIPMITLSHYVLPGWIAKSGGWSNPHTPKHFLEYVRRMLDEFDGIAYWIIINEPALVLTEGYLLGSYPPARQNLLAFMRARHHIINAHNDAYVLIKKTQPAAQVGSAYSLSWFRPNHHGSTLEHGLSRFANYMINTNYINHSHKYMDFLGVNYYTGYYVGFHPWNFRFTLRQDALTIPATLPLSVTIRPHSYKSDTGYPIAPDFFLNALHVLHEKYKLPIIVTENGIADRDDVFRAFYILTHMVALWRARHLGVPVKGYLHWSIIDNLEWNQGYSQRYGLVAINQFTQARQLRGSAELYREIMTSRTIDIASYINRYIPREQQESARRVCNDLLYSQHGRHIRCAYAHHNHS